MKLKKRFNPKLVLSILLLVFLVSTFIFSNINPVQAVVEDEETTTNINSVIPESPASDYISETTYVKDGDEITAIHNGLAINIVRAIAEALLGQKESQLIYDAATGEPATSADGQALYYREGGAIEQVIGLNEHLYNNPSASGINYAQSQWEMIKNGHVANAADPGQSWIYYPGLGYNILNPIQRYWEVTRNIAYAAMIIIIIIVAFMVAFRANLGGQTQITIANSIPNIIIALIMITISYALSGFAIDIITIGNNLSQQVLVQNQFSPGYEDVWLGNNLETGDFRGTSGIEDPKYHLQADDPAMSVWSVFKTSGVDIETEQGIANLIPNKGGPITAAIRNIIDRAVDDAGVVQYILELVFAIAAFMASLKLFFKIISKYIVLLLYPVISPFVMLTIAIPGQGTATISKYIRTLLSASLTLVAIYTVFLFMVVLTNDSHIEGEINLAPALIGYDVTATGVSLASYIQNILAFGLFLATPSIPMVVDQLLDVISPKHRETSASEKFIGEMQGNWGRGTARALNFGQMGYSKLVEGGDKKKQ